MCQFPNKTDNFNFLVPNLPKNGFWGRNSKNLNLDSKSAPPRYHVCEFSVKMDKFEFFGLNLGKLPNYMWYFCSNIVEGVAESLVETEMNWVEMDGTGWSWVELGAQLGNTHKNIYILELNRSHISLKVAYAITNTC